MKKKLGILIGILLVCIVAVAVLCTIISKENVDEKKSNGQLSSVEGKNVNEPILLEGMKAITFEEGKEMPIVLEKEEMKEGIWYDYIAQEETTEKGGTSRWANAMTLDGSMWVWIPRYAYKIEWDQGQNTGKVDIVFLMGTTNNNKEGQDVTTFGYKVHPAFTNGKENNYANGEWDEEITGIWVSKFEAGYAGQKNTASENIEIVETNLQYLRNDQNIIGEIESEKTYMTYPVFIGKTYSYNNLEVGEMYDLSQILAQDGNPYGFDESVNSHLIKNSEWGAVSYLAHSKYGRNGTKVSINNIDVSNLVYLAETVTGYTGNTISAIPNTLEEMSGKLKDSYNDKSYAWYTEEGKLGSTTGNLYGIYDMNGGSSEYTAGYIKTIDENLGNLFAKSMMSYKFSTKYYTVYNAANTDSNSTNENYNANKEIYGDAITETSLKGSGYNAWFGETSTYIKDNSGFFLRSGEYNRSIYSGLFDFTNHSGHESKSYSFRCVLIKQ